MKSNTFNKNFEGLKGGAIFQLAGHQTGSIVDFDKNLGELSSTQQLNIDYSDWENHTFFNSAQAKTNLAISKIINDYPFDGTEQEISTFKSNLTGFENWVFESFPKSSGSLIFDGTNYISVIDKAGITISEMSKNTSGKSVLDPELDTITISMLLNISELTGSSAICQKKNNNDGFTLYVSSSNTETSSIIFVYSSGTMVLSATDDNVSKNTWTHIAAQYDRFDDNLKLFRNGSLVASSSVSFFEKINFKSANFLIGSGTSHETFIQTSKFSGSIDELMVHIGDRSQYEISSSAYNQQYRSEPLKLYFKFNEPTGSYTNNDLAIDHSGNGLHTEIVGFSENQRTSEKSDLLLESTQECLNLFTKHEVMQEFNQSLLESAIVYDRNNPNLITKLIPQHYLVDEQNFYGLESIEGNISNTVGGSLPGQTTIPSSHVISSLLYTYAQSFDELKMFIDSLTALKNIEYTKENSTIPDEMLSTFSDTIGMELPNIFANEDIQRYLYGKNKKNITTSYRAVQNAIWRKILTEYKGILKKKGTIHSVKQIIRSAGIEPDKYLVFKEYGGMNASYIQFMDAKKDIKQGFITLTGSLSNESITYNSITGIPDNLPFVKSKYLSSSDGFWTDKAWAYEACYKFDKTLQHPATQSLVRFHVTGTSAPSSNHGIIANLICTNHETGSLLTLYLSPSGSDIVSLNMSGTNILNGNPWFVCITQSGSEEAKRELKLYAKEQVENSDLHFCTSTFYVTQSIFETKSDLNISGAFFVVGPQEITIGSKFINGSSEEKSQETMFSGKIGRIKFWSKELTDSEVIDHAYHLDSVGTTNPIENNSYAQSATDICRIDCWTKSQTVAISGTCTFYDYSGFENHLTGSGFSAGNIIFYDAIITNKKMVMPGGNGISNKILIKSLNSSRDPQIQKTPVFENNENIITNSQKFGIEISPISVLNEDIGKILATLNAIDDAFMPLQRYQIEYTSLNELSDIYFNRLKSEIKIRSLYDFFKWFDSTFEIIIKKMIPLNTQFEGINYVIQQHTLERSKVLWNSEEIETEKIRYYSGRCR